MNIVVLVIRGVIDVFFLFFGILCGSGGNAMLSRSRSLYSSSVMLTH